MSKADFFREAGDFTITARVTDMDGTVSHQEIILHVKDDTLDAIMEDGKVIAIVPAVRTGAPNE